MSWMTSMGPAVLPIYEYTDGVDSIATDDRGLFLRHPDGSEVTWAEYQAAAASPVRAPVSLDYSWDPAPAPPRCDCGSEAAGCGPGAHSSWCSVAEVRA